MRLALAALLLVWPSAVLAEQWYKPGNEGSEFCFRAPTPAEVVGDLVWRGQGRVRGMLGHNMPGLPIVQRDGVAATPIGLYVVGQPSGIRFWMSTSVEDCQRRWAAQGRALEVIPPIEEPSARR